MKNFFILGLNRTLSAAEIYSLYPSARQGRLAGKEVFLFDDNKVNIERDILSLGGTPKAGVIGREIKKINEKTISNYILEEIGREPRSKLLYGISIYGEDKINKQRLGILVKKILRSNKLSCRYVSGEGNKNLSSVTVNENRLLKKGLEVVIVCDKNRLYIGKTIAVQPYKELSARDYGRPARDDKSGMLPPKLAMMMLNIGGLNINNTENKSTKLLDPFCGSGTVLMEALLRGVKNVSGTDLSHKAVADTKDNISWLNKKFGVEIGEVKVEQSDVRLLSQKVKISSFDMVITEPFLGPQRGKIEINKVKNELEILYQKSIEEIGIIMKKNSSLVMVWPVFNQGRVFLNPKINGFKQQEIFSSSFAKENKLHLTGRNTMVYSRANQRVWREIIKMKKI